MSINRALFGKTGDRFVVCPRWIPIVLTFHHGVFVLAANAAGTTAIVGGTVVDLDGKAPIENAVILVEGDRIAAIGASRQRGNP